MNDNNDSPDADASYVAFIVKGGNPDSTVSSHLVEPDGTLTELDRQTFTTDRTLYMRVRETRRWKIWWDALRRGRLPPKRHRIMTYSTAVIKEDER